MNVNDSLVFLNRVESTIMILSGMLEVNLVVGFFCM